MLQSIARSSVSEVRAHSRASLWRTSRVADVERIHHASVRGALPFTVLSVLPTVRRIGSAEANRTGTLQQTSTEACHAIDEPSSRYNSVRGRPTGIHPQSSGRVHGDAGAVRYSVSGTTVVSRRSADLRERVPVIDGSRVSENDEKRPLYSVSQLSAGGCHVSRIQDSNHWEELCTS